MAKAKAIINSIAEWTVVIIMVGAVIAGLLGVTALLALTAWNGGVWAISILATLVIALIVRKLTEPEDNVTSPPST
ncbi:MAG TPA: hypothetical protein VM366_12110 [Anaerolineae bacterium]|nr:hypothetical protein [Anaerolineae bacterium]